MGTAYDPVSYRLRKAPSVYARHMGVSGSRVHTRVLGATDGGGTHVAVLRKAGTRVIGTTVRLADGVLGASAYFTCICHAVRVSDGKCFPRTPSGQTHFCRSPWGYSLPAQAMYGRESWESQPHPDFGERASEKCISVRRHYTVGKCISVLYSYTLLGISRELGSQKYPEWGTKQPINGR